MSIMKNVGCLMALFAVFGVGFGLPSQKKDVSAADYEHRFRKSLECVKNMLKEGLPEMGLPSYNPLVLKKLSFDLAVLGMDFLRGNVSFTNLTIDGPVDFNLTELEVTDIEDPEWPTFNFVILWPRYGMKGSYDFNFKFRDTKVMGKGDFRFIITNYTYSFKLKPVLPLTRETFGIKLSFDDINFHMDELLVDGEDVANEIEESLKTSIATLKQNSEVINSSMNDILIGIINNAYINKTYKKDLINEVGKCWTQASV